MKHFAILLILLCTPISSFAYGDANEAYVEQFNRLLERFASNSNYKVAYENATNVNAPIAGNYILLEAPSVVLNYQGFQYTLSTRKIALTEGDGDIRSVSLPTSMRLEVTPTGSSELPALFALNVKGLPKMELQLNSREDTAYYRLLAPDVSIADTVSVRTERLDINEKTAESGYVKFKHGIAETTGWNKVEAVDSSKLGEVLLQIVTHPLKTVKRR